MSTHNRRAPEGYHTLTPYLTVNDAGTVLEFLERGLGAKLLQKQLAPDGSIAHAELQIGDSRVMLSTATAQWPALSAGIYLYADDTDRLYHQAIAAGGKSVLEPADMSYGDRNAGVVDPGGNYWWIATRVA